MSDGRGVFVPDKPLLDQGGGVFVPAKGAPGLIGVPARPVKPKKTGGGVLGTLGHIVGQTGSDIGHAVTGLIPGAVKVGETVGSAVAADVHQAIHHPTQTQSLHDFLHGKPGSARAKLGALEAGTVKQTGEQLTRPFTHPTDPHLGNFALAALTVGSLGAGGVGRVGAAAKAARGGESAGTVVRSLVTRPSTRAALPIRSPRKVATGEGPTVTKLSETQPLVKARQVASNKALAKVKYTRRVVGEGARYGKEIRRSAVREGLQNLPAYRTYVKATRKLNDAEWKALNLIPRDVHPTDLQAYWKGTAAEKIVADPKVAKLMTDPSPRLQAAVAAARQLSEHGATVYKELGLSAEKSPSLFRERVATKLGSDVQPLHGQPFYMPDVPARVRSSDPFAAFGGGKGQPRIPGSAKQNKGVLQELGKLNLQQDVLGPNFLSRVKLKTHAAIHQGLLKSAVKVTPQQLDAMLAEQGGIPKGWDYITAPTVTKTVAKTVSAELNPAQMRFPGTGEATKTTAARVKLQTPTRLVGGTPQKIGQLKRGETTTGATPEELANLLQNPQALGDRLAQPLGTADKAQAYFDGTHYYLAPRNTIKAATGEFHQASGVVRALVERPLTVWRAIILGYRVGFLTNNVVGNGIMYAVRTAGIGGLRAYLNAVREAKGPNAVKQLLTDAPTTAKLGNRVTKQLMDEFFPEQVQGTFGRTQSPVLEGMVTSTRARKLGEKAKAGIIPATQSVAETIPRRALVETMIRNSPEFRRVYQDLPKQTRTFEQAARKTLTEQGPEYQRLISDQVNRTMGDYLNMSTFERSTVRQVLPFYSWYKAIATITAHLALDTPGRMLAVQQLSKIGNDWVAEVLGAQPSYQQGAVPIGKPKGGIATILGTQGLNPYSTVPQLARGLTGDISSLGLSPQIMGALDAYAQLKGYGGGKAGLAQVLAEFGKSFATGLPQARIIAPPPPSKLYPQQNRLTQILSSAGVPLKKESLTEAHKRAKQGK